MVYTWDPSSLPPPLAHALDGLAPHYPALQPLSKNACRLDFVHSPALSGPVVQGYEARQEIQYNTLHQALRGVGTVLAGLTEPGTRLVEECPFSLFGVMIDCSRNAVMKPEHIKHWMRQLALLGYNMLMLYTEDTYTLPDEPYFGYLRGGYSLADLQDLDAYAHGLGIEMIGCIQTLGHLEHVLKWSPYWAVKDTASVLLVDEQKTYALIDKMIAQYAAAYRTRRIHIGMDETHDLGRGRFLDQYGYTRGYDLFQRHLAMVTERCAAHGLQPMLWSDMYFRMGNPRQQYYDPETKIPEEVQRAIPSSARLVYWDYYHEESAFYGDWIKRHRALGHEPVMASGLWTWGGYFGYAHHQTRRTVPPCLQACKAAGVKELFFTLWGDDGAYCEMDTALAGLVYAAECAGGDAPEPAPDRGARRYAAICGADYQAIMTASESQSSFLPALLFWDDPLLAIYWKNEQAKGPNVWPNVLRELNRTSRALRPHAQTTTPVDLAHWLTVIDYLRAVIRFRLKLDAAYASGNADALAKLEQQAKRLSRQLDRCHESFRRQWTRRNRPQGFETIQHRIGARQIRWLELAQRLCDYRQGDADGIPELDEKPTTPVTLYARWRDVAAGGIP